jgi:hypothetical protein
MKPQLLINHRMKNLCDSLESARGNRASPWKRGLAKSFMLAFAFMGLANPALHSQDVVVPNDLAESDGNTAFTTPEGTVNGLRFMDMYDASQFQALARPAYLTGFSLRPDEVPGASGPRTIRARIYVSTTRRSLADFSTQFSENLGADNTLVFDGTLVVRTDNLPGPGNTRQFDYAWTFTTPFLYDPSVGNLVVDVQILQSSGSATRLDGVLGSEVSRQLSAPGSATATSGQFSGGGNVTRFSFEPAHAVSVRASEVEVCWESLPEATYRVEWRSEVSPGDWKPLVDCIRSTGTMTCVRDSVTAGQGRRFYRVVRAACAPQ